jgi:hypothetical protein
VNRYRSWRIAFFVIALGSAVVVLGALLLLLAMSFR